MVSPAAAETPGGDRPPTSYAAWQPPAEDVTDPFEDEPAPIPAPPTVEEPFDLGGPDNVIPWDTDIEELRDRVVELDGDRELRRLTERVREVQEFEYGKDVTDEPWQHDWGGRIQADMVGWPNDIQFGSQPNYVEFRRLRLYCSGEGYGVWFYQFDFDLAPDERRVAPVVGGTVDLTDFGLEIKDAYLGIKDLPLIGSVQGGYSKVPFGLEWATNSNYITFMERGLPRALQAGREFGILAHQYVPAADLTWSYGVFYEDFSETAKAFEDDNQGLRAGFRFTWAPWYDEPTEGRHVLHTGMWYLYSHDADDTVRFRTRPEIHRGSFLIDTGEIAATTQQQLGVELAWVRGPLSLQSELIWTHVNDTGPGNTEPWGAYAYASYFLTGEHRPYDRDEGKFGRVRPFENFWLVNTPCGCAAGWGAWELAVRWSYMDFIDVDGQQLHDVTFGANWYWNPRARLMFNWIHPMRHNNTDGVAEGDVLGARFQVDF